MASQLKPTTIVAVSVGVVVTGLLAYAVYFDHRRRTDPEFRKALKRESKRQERVAKQEAEAHGAAQRKLIREAVDRAKSDGLPKDPEEVESFFMNEVARGEGACQDGSDPIDAALCFYRALKVYPQPKELITIYEKTVPKPVIDVLAEMIAYDQSISVDSKSATSSTSQIDD